jgi:2-dehydro-3-deoxyglucarate aldolase
MIKRNLVLQRLENNQVALGGWVLTGSVVAAEIMAQAGFHWVCVDAEHSQISEETVANMFRAIEKWGSEPFVRVSRNEETEIMKFLDMGARGIIVPMIKSPGDVNRALSAMKYPPKGKRSFSLSRCTGYGLWSDEYFKKSEAEIFFGIMIEHIDAIPNLDEIFSIKGIDAVFIGPYDLSGSMGIPGEFDNHLFKETLETIYEKACEYKITLGAHEIHPGKETIQTMIDRGIRFIACGTDTLFLLEKSLDITCISKPIPVNSGINS